MPTQQVETDVEAFIQSLAGWEPGKTPTFSECVLGAVAHSTLLGYGATIITDLAGEFECGTSAIVRWAKGSTPMPGIQKLVVASIAKRLRQQADEAAKRHREAHAAFRQMSLAAQATEGEDD